MKLEETGTLAPPRGAATGEPELRARHFGSAFTSVSHFWSRRLRSAEEPYFAKS